MIKTKKQLLDRIHNELMYNLLTAEIEIALASKKNPNDIIRSTNTQTSMGIVTENYTMSDHIKENKDTIKRIEESIDIVKQKSRNL